jgi:acetolactate synthase-1/2/3 large subunit
VNARRQSGAEALCEALLASGVSHVFGLPGSQTLGLYEALRRSRLRAVLTTHELAAAFMANGYYRASGRPAAVFTIPGPGFTYALTGLAEALHDSAALVHVVGQPPPGGRKFEFQALDQRAIAAPLVKGVLAIERAGDAAERTAAAVALATAGEPGPVLLEWSAAAMEEAAEQAPPRPKPAPPSAPPDRVSQVADALCRARRPVLLLGQGAAGAAGLARRLAEALGAPVLTTVSGRGVLPEDHPLALGFDFARGGAADLAALVEEADCVLALGCKLGAAGTGIWALRIPPERLVRVDASPEVLAANHPARIAVAADAGALLALLVPAVEQRADRPAPWPRAEVAAWRARLRRGGDRAAEPAFHGVAPPRAEAFFAALRRALPRDGIVVTDSGLHQDLARRYLEVWSPRGLIAPSDFQSMGFGLPAAIGARLAAPGRAVVAVVGDGGLAMSGLELLTAVRERLPLPVVVVNDGWLNRIRLQQLATYGRAEAVGLQNPDFAALAHSVGASYALVDGDPEEVLRRALAASGPTLVEVGAGDSPSIHLSRAAGLARGVLRRTYPRWLRRRGPRGS